MLDRRLVAGILLLLLLGQAVRFSAISLKSGSVDLRNRVVSSRLLKTACNPYTYHWEEGDPERYLDPNDLLPVGPNRCTASPAVLLVLKPLASLPWPRLVKAWLLLQWLLAALCTFLLWQIRNEPRTLALSALVFSSGAWFMHLERGQTSILYTCVLILSAWLSQRNVSASGAVWGVAALLRPSALVFAIPFLIVRQWRWLAGGLVVLGAGFLVSGFPIWRDYWSAMEAHGRMHVRLSPGAAREYARALEPLRKELEDVPAVKRAILHGEGATVVWEPEWKERYQDQGAAKLKAFQAEVVRHGFKVSHRSAPPSQIEGERGLERAFPFPYPGSGLSKIVNDFSWPHRLTGLKVLSLFLVAGATVFLSRHGTEPSNAVFRGALLVMAAEFLLPAPRYAYANVGWLFPLALLDLKFEWNFWRLLLFYGFFTSLDIFGLGVLDFGASNVLLLLSAAVLGLSRTAEEKAERVQD